MAWISFRVPNVCEALKTQKNPRHVPCPLKSNRTAVALCRASTSSLGARRKTGMAGTSPAMTAAVRLGSGGKHRMHRALAFMLMAALASPALAQDQPKPLKTVKINEPAPGMDTLYAIDEDGTVRIDWRTAEILAATKADRTVLPIALLMLAIRDATWKPVRREPPEN